MTLTVVKVISLRAKLQLMMAGPREALSEYATATNNHDLQFTLNLVADEAVYWFSDASSHVGIAAIKAALESNFSAIEEEVYEISSLRWIVDTEDAGVCLYRFNWSGVIAGAAVEGSGRGTSVLTRTGEGWRILHEHLSSGSVGF